MPTSSGEVLQGTEALLRLLDGFSELREADQPRKAYKAPVSLQRKQSPGLPARGSVDSSDSG